jgi:hypothetical protein
MRSQRVVVVVVVLSLLAAFGYWLGNHWQPALPPAGFGAECIVEADGRVRLDTDQMANAATIAATGVRLGMPEQAIVVALATAFQESKLRNLPHLGAHNDHDSLGLFQQRPSQGWGTEAEIRDPRYAAERFYLALREVDGWEEMRVTDAAQRVQRSAFPEAYERWAGDAAVLAGALLGRAGGAVACRFNGDLEPVTADEVRDEFSRDWGEGTEVTAARDEGWVRVGADGPQAGWRYAHWLVSHAAMLGVARVQFADLEWRADTGSWRETQDRADLGVVHAHLGQIRLDNS